MIRAAYKLASGSLLGKCAGVLREILLAALFGTSNVVAAIRVAQSATLIPVNFFTADSLSAGFLPLYSRYSRDDEVKARLLFWWLAGLLFLATVLIVCLLQFSSKFWIGWLVPGFGEQDRLYAVEFIRVMAIGVPFYVAGGLFSYLEMGHGFVTLVSVRATLQSAGMILGTIGAFVLHKPSLLAWGFTSAYVFYAGWGLIRVIRQGWVPIPSRMNLSGLREVAAQFWLVVRPLLLLPVLLQGNIAVERAVASLCGVEASASLDYAKFVTDTGVLLLAVPIGLAGLSSISRMSAEETKELLAKLLPPLLLITVPLSTALGVHAHLVVSMIYERGHFGESSTLLTCTILWGFALGFWAQAISYVLMKVLSAQLRNAEVFRFMGIALAANALINVGLYRWFGPVVLGIGGCIYGLVLLFFGARSFGLGHLLRTRLLWLSIGSSGYALVGQFMPVRGWIGVSAVMFFFVIYWLSFMLAVPVIRRDVSPLWSRWRLRAA